MATWDNASCLNDDIAGDMGFWLTGHIYLYSTFYYEITSKRYQNESLERPVAIWNQGGHI